RADRLAREAMAEDAERFDVLLLHGRSAHSRGDMTTAALSMTRALSLTEQPDERAEAGALLAQVRYVAGDRDQAARFANMAIEVSSEPNTRLEGRNVLGKLLLAREAWTEAESHFAEDAHEAAVHGLREKELRSRLNRSIAVLYLGRRDEARGLLEEVMRDGEKWGLPRAVAFSMTNLATIAILQHDYERALTLSEKAIRVRRQLGGRLGLVQPITNLAELRLRLGLVDEAEQGLRFGLQACSDGLPPSRYAYFAKVAACIHLERGETTAAASELGNALSGAMGSGERSLLAQCHRIAADIALEDGDLPRARVAIEQASKLRHTDFGRAELAVLRARLLRATGESYMDAAHEALSMAQQADDPESLRHAHTLLAFAYRTEGREERMAAHVQAAVTLRERTLSALPAPWRSHFASRRALRSLQELETGVVLNVNPVVPEEEEEEVPTAAPTPVSTSKKRTMVGDSPAMSALKLAVRRVAATDATVLIHGPTGTGKELVAEAVHHQSGRASGPLVKVNCAALVETLLLSELFGHEKGAFTGASARKRGRFEVAEGGTLFLDEIGDISSRTQVALLRVLQDGSFERVGGTSQLKASVRVVCATHRDLRAMVEQGTFREDLYYRLCGVVVEVPALKERIADLPALAEALLDQAHERHGIQPKPLSDDAVRLLSRHEWPGNIRELENALRVAALFAPGPEVTAADFREHVEALRHLDEVAPMSLREAAPVSIVPPASNFADAVYTEVKGGIRLADMKKKLEEDCITRALLETGGNITRAADLLGMKRPRLSQLVKQYNLAKLLAEIKS
ncbi:MAG: sigma 54-interacting transcriptional regulator, partial [Myxococcota bacterium]